MFEQAARLYTAGHALREIATMLETYPSKIWKIFKEHGFKCRTCAVRNQWGENNKNWVGDKATRLTTYHERLKREKGRPNKCEVCGTTKSRKFEWANLTGDYANLNDYKRMCCSCHAKYDNKIRNLH